MAVNAEKLIETVIDCLLNEFSQGDVYMKT